MFDAARLLYFYTETPLHAGSGSSVSWVDLPIQREKHTGFPMVQGSGVKGVLRDEADRAFPKDSRVEEVFGPDTNGADKFGGSLTVTDARLLLFPVRSFSGVFAWVTCPLALARYQRELDMAGGNPATFSVPAVTGSQAAVSAATLLKTGQGAVILEDLAFAPVPSSEVDRLAEALKPALPQDEFLRGRLANCLAVVSDEAFRSFVTFSTEVVSRIRLDETGTVASGALWSEELLPSDALLYALALATRPRKGGATLGTAKDVLGFLGEKVLSRTGVLQMGGDETIGRGLVWVAQGLGRETP